ncbi:hypothetical protein FOZ61_004370 [Perkinsus olseni]|uniref:Uncharacterized protein n=1 Tax=Perkinsus olseni TaxID=32597 RepID=A0A7J6MD78_PEROL|nr:hypothetical protein FOZ61_004370 [Perkinsus olseni]
MLASGETQQNEEPGVPLNAEESQAEVVAAKDYSHVTWRSSSPFASTPDPFLEFPTYPLGHPSIPAVLEQQQHQPESHQPPPGLLPFDNRAPPFPTPMTDDHNGACDKITLGIMPNSNTSSSLLDLARVLPVVPPPPAGPQRDLRRQRSLSESSLSSWEDSSAGSSSEECPTRSAFPNPRVPPRTAAPEVSRPVESALGGEGALNRQALPQQRRYSDMTAPPQHTGDYPPNPTPFNGIAPLLSSLPEYDIVQQLALLQQQAWVLGQLHATNEIFRNYNLGSADRQEPQQKQEPAPTTRTSGHLSSGQATPEEIRSFVEECRPCIRMLATDRYGNYFVQELCHHIDPTDICNFLKELVTTPNFPQVSRDVAGSKVLVEMTRQLKKNRDVPPEGIVEVAEVIREKLSNLLSEPSCFFLLGTVMELLPTGDYSDQFIDAIIHASDNLLAVANNRNGSLLLSTCVTRKPDCIPDLCQRIALVIDGDNITLKRQLSEHGNRLLKTIKSYHGQPSKSA